jgi:hypothetical protein
MTTANNNEIPKPEGYQSNNGHGQPTHLRNRRGEWIATPKGYRIREEGLPSHKYLRNEEGRMEWFEVPSFKEIESWVYDSVCETPEGDPIEPDNPRSWLSILGLI